jgi:hypothetical protein
MSTAQTVPRLVCDYRPSQPHGWPPAWPGQSIGVTLGGHTRSADFAHNGNSYRVQLLSDPVYETVPTDPQVTFGSTLGSNFDGQYAFRYAGGLAGNGRFRVESYSVTVSPAIDGSPLSYGADLYVTYEGAATGRAARFIHVFHTGGTVLGDATVLDNGRRANPYTVDGGPTSANGRRVTNFYGAFAAFPMDDEPDLTGEFVAEVFLAWDTGTRDGSGRDVVTVAGGIRYGWQVVKVAA